MIIKMIKELRKRVDSKQSEKLEVFNRPKFGVISETLVRLMKHIEDGDSIT